MLVTVGPLPEGCAPKSLLSGQLGADETGAEGAAEEYTTLGWDGLTAETAELTTGAAELATETTELTTGTPELIAGAELTGATELTAETTELTTGAAELATEETTADEPM